MKKEKIIQFLKTSLILLICVFIATPNHIYAMLGNAVRKSESKKIIRETERLVDTYVTLDTDEIPYFDVEEARKNGESEENIEFGELFNEYSYDMNNVQNNEIQTRVSIPIWGNWCGPGYGHGEPIDLLDEGCKIHDGCYEPGKKNCGCNQILIDYIDRNIYRMTGGQRQMAKVVRSYFAFENWRNGC